MDPARRSPPTKRLRPQAQRPPEPRQGARPRGHHRAEVRRRRHTQTPPQPITTWLTTPRRRPARRPRAAPWMSVTPKRVRERRPPRVKGRSQRGHPQRSERCTRGCPPLGRGHSLPAAHRSLRTAPGLLQRLCRQWEMLQHQRRRLAPPARRRAAPPRAAHRPPVPAPTGADAAGKEWMSSCVKDRRFAITNEETTSLAYRRD